eukprot:757476-Lingulodinium_polyedra.AAC.1
MYSDGEEGAASDRDAAPPPPMATTGSSRDRGLASANGGPSPETSYRGSPLGDDEGSSFPRAATGVFTQVKEAVRASKQYEK